MTEVRRFICATGGRDYVSMPASDYDALLAERDELLGALDGLEAAHCGASPYLAKAKLSFGSKSLIAARVAIAKARGDV
jgi:hypothetical protein